MIPREPIELTASIPGDWSYWTPKRDDISEEGVGYFRGTWLIRGVWIRDARAAISAEVEIVTAIDSLASDPTQFDEIATTLETCEIDELPADLENSSAIQAITRHLIDEGMSPLGGLEIGVAGLVYALSATGCWPAASCRGHPGGWATHPVVYLAADRHRVRTLRDLVAAAGCGLDTDPSRGGLLMIMAASIEDTMRLAQTVLDSRAEMTPKRGPRKQATPSAAQLRLDLG